MATRPRTGRKAVKDLSKVLTSAVLAERLGVSVRTVQRWQKEGPPPARREQLGRVVVTQRERVVYEARKSHDQARRRGKLEAPGDAPGFNKSGAQETRQYKGTVINRRMPTGQKSAVVTPKSEEQIVFEIMQQAAKVAGKRSRGRFFVTMGLVEFGQPIGSGGKRLRTVEKGKLGGMAAYQSWVSTSPNTGERGVIRGSQDLAGLEVQVRELVGSLARNKSGASVIDSITVKRYEQKSEGEIEAWDSRTRKTKKRR